MANEKMSFEQKVISVQNELNVPKLQWNKFGKYAFRSNEDILHAVKPLNLKYGLLLIVTDEIVMIGERVYVKATARLSDGENHLEVHGYARESLNKKGQDDSQVTGATSSYARKYALNGLYLIDDNKDFDTPESKEQQNNSPQQYQGNQQSNQVRTATKNQVEKLINLSEQLSKAHDMNHQKTMDGLGIHEGMTEVKYKEVLKRITEGLQKVNK